MNTHSKISVAAGVFAGLFATILYMYWRMKRREAKKLKKRYFKRNGGDLLQQIASYGSDQLRVFSTDELKKATNNYYEGGIVSGKYGAVEKGILTDGTVVTISKSKHNASTDDSEQFINEVITLSQIIHLNLVSLIGCCLDTEKPLLVYKLISNGSTLYDRIHRNDEGPPLPLELRLRIAAGIAEVLAYLHYSTSSEIIHKDVNATNILLDDNYTAKLAPQWIFENQNQQTLVEGTLGYLDPEYLHTNTLTEKSDVYSFGVVLVELLTSKPALSFNRPEAERNLAKLFIRSVEGGCLDQILDAEILNDESIGTLKRAADLAKRCLRLRGEERPTMKEVAAEIEGLLVVKYPPGGKDNFFQSPTETDHLLVGSPSNACVVEVRGDGDDDSGSSVSVTSHDNSTQIEPQRVSEMKIIDRSCSR